jgi:hypothetical protein
MPGSSQFDFKGRWIHFITTTYGAWLYGDPRGFRTRHHREHVEGDYKSPPPAGTHSQRFRRSAQSLKQPPVRLTKIWRPRVGKSLRDKLDAKGARVLCLAVAAQHVHVLAKVPAKCQPRLLMGFAKKHAAFEAKSHGWQGKLWGRRGKEVRVKDRRHQLQIYRYILAHGTEGAWTWKFTKPTDSRPWA